MSDTTGQPTDAELLAEFRIEAYYPAAGRHPSVMKFAHIGTCGWSTLAPPTTLDQVARLALEHARMCTYREDGGYPRVNAPTPAEFEAAAPGQA